MRKSSKVLWLTTHVAVLGLFATLAQWFADNIVWSM